VAGNLVVTGDDHDRPPLLVTARVAHLCPRNTPLFDRMWHGGLGAFFRFKWIDVLIPP
jgi:hypothetical protein